MTYIATFFSHFGAVRFKKTCEKLGIPAQTMPVPRSLSSSCGICTKFEADSPCPAGSYSEETEKVVLLTENGYELIYKAEE